VAEALASAHRADDWAGDTGDTWLAYADRFESMLSPVGGAFLEHAGFAPGERVVDIGCGAGGTSFAIAERVGPSGSVTGIDISAALVAESARRAGAAGLANARFVAGDATVVMPEDAPFDRLFSRFGSMFFSDFAAAFANLHRLVRPGGRIDLAVWASPQENAWLLAARDVLARFVDLPPPDPEAPSPVALADPERVRRLLTGAGFAAIEHTLWRGPQLVGGKGSSPASAADFMMEAMPMANAVRAAPAAIKVRIREELIAMLTGYDNGSGVEVPAAAWFVTASA
jgi:SAM-dependent methyltransferase